MDITKNEALRFLNESEDIELLVAVLELTAHKTKVNTISEIARHNQISPNGVKSSNRFRKIRLGKALMAIPNLRHEQIHSVI